MYHDKSRFGAINEAGMTLLEVMLTLSLSLVIITALTSLYLHFHQAFLNQQRLNAHQHDALKLALLLQEEIALAGHVGCAKLSAAFRVIPYENYQLTTNNALESDLDSLTVRYQSFPGAVLLAIDSHLSLLTSNNGLRFHPGQLVIISDCQHAEIFQVKKVAYRRDSQVIEPMQPLHFIYQPFAELGYYIVHQYRLQGSALLRIDHDGRKNMIIDHIIQLSFSADSKGIAYHYMTRHLSSVKKWSGYAAKT